MHSQGEPGWSPLTPPPPPPSCTSPPYPFPYPLLHSLGTTSSQPPALPPLPPPPAPPASPGEASPRPFLALAPALAVGDKEPRPGPGARAPSQSPASCPHPQPSKGPPTKPPLAVSGQRLRPRGRERQTWRRPSPRTSSPWWWSTRRLALGKTGSGVGRLACSCPTRLQAHPRSPHANSSAVRAPHCASWPGDRAGYHVGGGGQLGLPVIRCCIGFFRMCPEIPALWLARARTQEGCKMIEALSSPLPASDS